jgi:hypothetical protein
MVGQRSAVRVDELLRQPPAGWPQAHPGRAAVQHAVDALRLRTTELAASIEQFGVAEQSIEQRMR